MFALTAVLAALLAAAFLLAGLGKLTGQEMMAQARKRFGMSDGLWKAVGGLELAGAAGVLAGLHEDLAVVAVVAAVGLIAMTIGATHHHQKAGDGPSKWLPAVMIGSLAIFYIIARIASA